MKMADALKAVEAALVDARCAIIAVSGATPIDDVLTDIRGGGAPMFVVLAGPDLTAVDRAMMLAAIGALAIEIAPQRRVGALDIAASASDGAIAAAARFLAEAESTTGQILAII